MTRSTPLDAARLLLCVLALTAGSGFSAPSAQAQDDRSHEEVRRDALFQKLDANRDGRISRAEASHIKAFAAAFDEADDDGDGYLSTEEFIKARAIYQRIQVAQYLSDSMITAKVKAALMRTQELGDISVETRDGRVILSGNVGRREQRTQASRIAASVAGVTGVKNELDVKSNAN